MQSRLSFGRGHKLNTTLRAACQVFLDEESGATQPLGCWKVVICNLAMLIHFVSRTRSSTSSAAHSWALTAVCGT